MKLINSSFEIIEQKPGLEGIYKQIELAGRTCYKSESNITEDSAKAFVDRMIKSGHGAMLEHGTVYLTIPGEHEPDEWGRADVFINYKGSYTSNKYSKVVVESWEQEPVGTQCEFCKKIPRRRLHITTNLRVLVENDWLDDLQYLCEPTEYHEKRVTVRFICDRGVSHEFVRHRVSSFAQESTRYCNYIKDKFGGSVTFIIPPWLQESEELEYEEDLKIIESLYFKWLNKGWTAQQARGFLCHFLKTELVMTGFIDDWKHFFLLRSSIALSGKPHPQAEELAQPLMIEFINKGYMESIT